MCCCLLDQWWQTFSHLHAIWLFIISTSKKNDLQIQAEGEIVKMTNISFFYRLFMSGCHNFINRIVPYNFWWHLVFKLLINLIIVSAHIVLSMDSLNCILICSISNQFILDKYPCPRQLRKGREKQIQREGSSAKKSIFSHRNTHKNGINL